MLNRVQRSLSALDMEASEAVALPSEPEAELFADDLTADLGDNLMEDFADDLTEDVELSTMLSDEEDLEVISMKGEKDDLDEETVLEKPETQGAQLGPSTEARRLKEALESRQPSVDEVGDTNDIDDLDLDLENLIGSESDAGFEDVDDAGSDAGDVDMEEFDQLLSQVDLEGREADEDPLAGEDKSQVLGKAEKEEKLTPTDRKNSPEAAKLAHQLPK